MKFAVLMLCVGGCGVFVRCVVVWSFVRCVVLGVRFDQMRKDMGRLAKAHRNMTLPVVGPMRKVQS